MPPQEFLLLNATEQRYEAQRLHWRLSAIVSIRLPISSLRVKSMPVTSSASIGITIRPARISLVKSRTGQLRLATSNRRRLRDSFLRTLGNL